MLLVSIGVFIFCIGGIRYHELRVLSFTKTPEEAQTMITGELPIEINISSINVNLPVEVGEIKDRVWQISNDSATFLNTSARPGTQGNIVIYGHNKKAVFGSLPYLSTGQIITLKTQSGNIFDYKVTEKYFVKPERVDLVSPTNSTQLTLFTCWGAFDQERVVVKAIPSNN